MLDFIQELTESRMYKGSDTLRGKSASELAKATYLMILILEILRKEDIKYAQDYAQKTLAYDDFDHMRTNATDLHNLISVLTHQDAYASRMKEDKRISMPTLQTKRHLRDMIRGVYVKQMVLQYLMSVEKFLKIDDSLLKQMRRQVGEWQVISDREKREVKRKIKSVLAGMNQWNDIYTHFKK